MKRKKICILPKLHDYAGDTSRQWFVFYSYLNPASNKMHRFRIYTGLGFNFNKSQRYANARKIIDELTNKLSNNYNPFTDDQGVIYSDNLKYHHIADKTEHLQKGNKTFNFYMNQFLTSKKRSVRLSTYHTYRSKFRIFEQYLKLKKR